MDVNDGPLWSSTDSLDASLETQPPSPKVSDSDSPPAKPASSADIPPDSASRTPIYYDGLSKQLAQEQAIHRWGLLRHPEYGTLAKRTRFFYQTEGRWDPKGKPSVESLDVAGFYFERTSKYFLKILHFKYPTASSICDTHTRTFKLAKTDGVYVTPIFRYTYHTHTHILGYRNRLISLTSGWSDDCICFYCNCPLFDWMETDIPFKEHIEFYPNCPYIRYIEGHTFKFRTEVD